VDQVRACEGEKTDAGSVEEARRLLRDRGGTPHRGFLLDVASVLSGVNE
jgi:hypothetical protein